jgi:molecular chaperone GrpE (heat shock protein)
MTDKKSRPTDETPDVESGETTAQAESQSDAENVSADDPRQQIDDLRRTVARWQADYENL